MMKKPFKILGIIAIILVVLTVALIVLVRVLVTPERVQAFVLPKAEAALGREISFEGMEVSLLSGITLDRLTVLEPDRREPFIAADRVVLRYKLWPLLFRRVVVDEVRLEQPRIRIERRADGTFNFSDLIEPKTAAETAPADPDVAEGPPVDLLVSEISIEKGEVLFIDHLEGVQEPFRLQAGGVEVSARDISLDKPFPFRAEAQVGQGRISAEGEIDPQAGQGKMTAEVASLDLAAFAPYFADQVPGEVNALQLGLRLNAEGGKEALRSRGTVTVDPISVVIPQAGKKPLSIRDAVLSVDYAVAINLAAGSIDIEKGTVAFNRLPIEITGRVEDYASAPRVNLQVTLPETDVAKAVAALPPELLGETMELKPAGKVAASVRLAGAVAEPKRLLETGEVRLTPLSAVLDGTPVALTGVLRLTGDTLRSEQLALTMGENRAEIDLQAENLLGEPIRVRSALRADRFALDPLLQGAAAPAAAGKEPSGEQPGRKGGEPLDLPVTAAGSVRIGETAYKGLAVRDFDLLYRLEKNVVTVERLQGKVAGGGFGGTGKIDLGKAMPTYTSRLDLQGIQADPLITAFWPKMAGIVLGTMNTRIDVEGKGIDPEILKRNLSTRGEVRLTDGQLTGAGLVQGLADFLNLEELRVLRFSEAKGSFTVREGMARVDSDIQGRSVRLRPVGTINLDGYLLDIDLNLQLSPELAQRANLGKVGRLLGAEGGWTPVPLKVGGSFDSPRFYLATGGLREQAGEGIRKRLEKELDRRLPREIQPSPGESAPAEPPSGRRELEKTIRGLFGN